MLFIIRLTLMALVLLASFTSAEASNLDEKVRVTHINFPKLPPVSRSAVVYLTLENLANEALVLSEVTSPVAHHAMLHQTVEEDGMVKMRHQDNVIIPAKGKLELKPGGLHIMLMGLDKALMAKPFELSLVFADSEKVTVLVTP